VPGFTGESGSATLQALVQDLDGELPALLRGLRESGRQVHDLQVRRPTLAGVFLALTGKELRE
jgi:hypothetical protein